MNLGPDPVVLVLRPSRPAFQTFQDRRRVLLGACQHHLDRNSDRELRFGQLPRPGQHGGLGKIPRQHMGLPHFIQRTCKRLGQGRLHQSLLHSGPQTPGHDFE